MNILTISNLYPRPDKPAHGMYNAQLFDRFAQLGHHVRNWCLVPEFNVFKWRQISLWRSPHAGFVETVYRPVWYLPILGRAAAGSLYYRTLKSQTPALAEADLIYSTWLFPDGVTAGLLARDRGIPYGIMVQGTDVAHLMSRRRRKVILSAIEGAANVICVSTNLQDALLDAGAPPGKVHVVPNGVDGAKFKYGDREEAREKVGADRAEEIILYVGHLWPVKAVDLLLQAFALLKRDGEHRSTRLVVIGDGPERPKLEALARKLSVSQDVRFLGEQPHELIPLWMSAADCLCLSSRSEGMPNVVLEALASGLPVVATDVGAIPEMLAGEPGARVVSIEIRGQRSEVRSRRSDAAISVTQQLGNSTTQQLSARLAAALADLLETPIDRPAMAERHRGRHSWGQQAERILELMRTSTNGRER